jgi:hypothetical protein
LRRYDTLCDIFVKMRHKICMRQNVTKGGIRVQCDVNDSRQSVNIYTIATL